MLRCYGPLEIRDNLDKIDFRNLETLALNQIGFQFLSVICSTESAFGHILAVCTAKAQDFPFFYDWIVGTEISLKLYDLSGS